MAEEDARAPHVLLVQHDGRQAALLRRAMQRTEGGVRTTTVGSLAAATAALRRGEVACVVTDLHLPDGDGARVVHALRAAARDVPVIVVAATGTDEMAVAALRAGAADYVSGHARAATSLPVLVRAALGRAVLAAVDVAPPEAATVPTSLVAFTAGMRAVLALAERAAPSGVPVLIEGETGTGKELIARAIHDRSPRRDAPFLVQNCAALADTLLESELFGHVRGAFTGADRDRRGLFEEAAGGTVFLDEIAEAPPAVQAKLLRVLQHEEVKAVGADRVRRVRARVLAASNRTLEGEVRAGRFRADLYYRLAVLPIRVPPLRERAADVPPLVAHFLARFAAREGRPPDGVTIEALRALVAYPWPGNVRELENEVHRLVLTVRPGQRVARDHLAARIREADGDGCPEPLARILARVELALIRARLQQLPTKTAAARSLGITREALYAKMRRLGLRGG